MNPIIIMLISLNAICGYEKLLWFIKKKNKTYFDCLDVIFFVTIYNIITYTLWYIIEN